MQITDVKIRRLMLTGRLRDIVHPITPAARKMLEESILEAYERQTALLAAEEESEAMSAEAENAYIE